MLIAAEAFPPWLECASSMMIANDRPRCSPPISSRMYGNFWTVETMIFLPPSMKLLQVAGVLGVTDSRAHLKKLLDRVVELVVENSAVGHDDDRVEDRLVVVA